MDPFFPPFLLYFLMKQRALQRRYPSGRRRVQDDTVFPSFFFFSRPRPCSDRLSENGMRMKRKRRKKWSKNRRESEQHEVVHLRVHSLSPCLLQTVLQCKREPCVCAEVAAWIVLITLFYVEDKKKI